MKMQMLAIAFGLLLAGDAAQAESKEGAPAVAPLTGEWYRPTVNARWHWQLNGTVNTEHAVDVYVIDLFDTAPALIERLQATGRRVICYFSAGSLERWRPDIARYSVTEIGNRLADYRDERWLDIRSTGVRQAVLVRLDLAAAKGCDGVEPDNVDGYLNNTGFPLTAQDQLNFNAWLANAAHRRGLAVALKNDVEQAAVLEPYFDFAINESCHRYRECAWLMPFVAADKPVFNAEYEKKYVHSARARAALCQQARARRFRTLVLPVALDDTFRYSCD